MASNRLKFWVILLIILFIFIAAANYFIEKASEQKEKVAVIVKPAPLRESPDIPEGEVVRKVHLDPNRQYFESIFYVGDTEIARYKSVDEKIYDMTGTIPDGLVKFVNAFTSSYGEEYYRNGKRNGPYKEYYNEGTLLREAEYRTGQLLKNKDYFIDGKVKLEQDSEDALITLKNRESGIGKTYYRDGTLMFEWNITNHGAERFTRAYNIKGQLVEERQFDKTGQLIKTVPFHPEAEVVEEVPTEEQTAVSTPVGN
jgi:antitoxin component YwqK of YwqJK toxin-antitoxin module